MVVHMLEHGFQSDTDRNCFYTGEKPEASPLTSNAVKTEPASPVKGEEDCLLRAHHYMQLAEK